MIETIFKACSALSNIQILLTEQQQKRKCQFLSYGLCLNDITFVSNSLENSCNNVYDLLWRQQQLRIFKHGRDKANEKKVSTAFVLDHISVQWNWFQGSRRTKYKHTEVAALQEVCSCCCIMRSSFILLKNKTGIFMLLDVGHNCRSQDLIYVQCCDAIPLPAPMEEDGTHQPIECNFNPNHFTWTTPGIDFHDVGAYVSLVLSPPNYDAAISMTYTKPRFLSLEWVTVACRVWRHVDPDLAFLNDGYRIFCGLECCL